jgi:hypothetical protein
MSRFVPGFVHDGVGACCPDWWTHGCGLNGAFGLCADCLEVTNPILQQVGDAIWIFASPVAFFCIFCFPSDPYTDESSGYEVSMLGAPCRRPVTCCAATLCVPCAQWHVRRVVLKYDMTKYKLWQGYHDGPHCCAVACPGAPITIASGTYGEEKCPNTFLCLEVCCLAGIYSTCCAFDVSRRYQREERGLSIDPTEQRQRRCITFFSTIMHSCFQLGCCMCVSSCLVGICAPDSGGAQDCAGEAGRAARSCCAIAHTIWKGILWTRCIGMGCLTTQMLVEADSPWDGQPKARPDKQIMMMAPKAVHMDRDGGAGAPQQQPEKTKEIADLAMPWDDENNNNNNTQRPNNRRS